MILQIRTKDNLDDLLRHGNSPSWVVSDGKINAIEKVELFQFDGKRVLKADFDSSLSKRTESGRLIVAFSNGTIEEFEHKWIGQNPIKYVNNQVNEKLDSMNHFDKLQNLFISNSDDLGDEVNSLLENNLLPEYDVIYTSGFEDIFEEIEKFKNKYIDNLIFDKKLDEIKNTIQNEKTKWLEALKLFSDELIIKDCFFISTLSPNGGSDYCFIIGRDANLKNISQMFYHFKDTIENAVGWFEEYYEDFDISYEDFISKNSLDNSLNSIQYNVKEGFFGEEIEDNSRFIGIDETNYEYAKSGIFIAKKFCQ